MNCKNAILEVPFVPTTINPTLQAAINQAVAPLIDEIASLKAEMAILKATSSPQAEIAPEEVQITTAGHPLTGYGDPRRDKPAPG